MGFGAREVLFYAQKQEERRIQEEKFLPDLGRSLKRMNYTTSGKSGNNHPKREISLLGEVRN